MPPKVRTLAGNGTVENELARLAALSHGVVTRAQLLSVGITPDEIKHRLGTGSLLREHRGVYRVGHRAPNREARYMAAVRAAGSRAVLSGLAAAHLLDLIKGRPPKPEVTAPTERRIDGVRTRRARDLSRSERTIWRGTPVTSPERTIVDLAGALDFDALARLVHEAEVRFGTGPEAVERVLNRRPRSAGAGVLRRVLFGDAHVTLSALERRFLDLLRDAGLPLPITNRRAGDYYVDCRWPDRGLTVELDSYRYDRSRHAFEQDRRRERDARARGDVLIRFTWGDITERPAEAVTELHGLFGIAS